MSGWESDAQLAGTLYRKSKPYTAMLIARCVEPGKGGPRTGAKCASSREFSEQSGIARNTVNKYLRTWDAMAADGQVPARDELEPGVDVEVPDQKVWKYYYREANPPKPRHPKEQEPKDPGDIPPDTRMADLRDNPRAMKLLEAASNGASDVPGVLGAQLTRAVTAAFDLVMDDDPARAFMRLVHSMTELSAEMRRLELES